ncbi:MAG: hypothetical protein ABEI86_09950, partial [Halobacteriaceae archaeon]
GSLRKLIDIDAIINVAESPKVNELIVIGDGPQRESLETKKQNRSIDSLRITGSLPDKEAYSLVSSSQVAINPQKPSKSQLATSPVKLYYYAGLETAIVASTGPSLVRNLTEFGGAVGIGEQVSTARQGVELLLRNQQFCQEVSSRAKEFALNCTWDRRISEHISELEEKNVL